MCEERDVAISKDKTQNKDNVHHQLTQDNAHRRSTHKHYQPRISIISNRFHSEIV